MSNGEPTNFNAPVEIHLDTEGLYIYSFGDLPTEYENSPAHCDTYVGYSVEDAHIYVTTNQETGKAEYRVLPADDKHTDPNTLKDYESLGLNKVIRIMGYVANKRLFDHYRFFLPGTEVEDPDRLEDFRINLVFLANVKMQQHLQGNEANTRNEGEWPQAA